MTGRARCRGPAAEPRQKPGDHAPVDGTQHRVRRAGVAERALFGHHCRGVAPVLGVRGEPVGGQRVGHHVHGRPDGPLPFGRRHLGGQGEPVLLADVRRHLLGLLQAQPLHGFGQEPHEEVVPSLHEPDRQLLFDAEELFGGPSGAGCLAGRLDAQVPPVHQTLQVVPGHVGVEGEGGGHLCRRHPGPGPDVEEDVAAGRIAEGRGHGGHRGGEPPVVGAVAGPRLRRWWRRCDRGRCHDG